MLGLTLRCPILKSCFIFEQLSPAGSIGETVQNPPGHTPTGVGVWGIYPPVPSLAH